MSEMAISHCRGNYLREFAHKTTQGVDKPNKEGYLADLRRLRANPIRYDAHLSYIVKKYSDRPGEYITVYSFERFVKKGDTHINGNEYPEKDIGSAIYYESAKINRIYLDFDFDSNPQIALNQAILVMRELFKRDIHVHCYFSGNKGIAMYIEFKTMEIQPENKKEVLAAFFDVVKDMISDKYENFCGMVLPVIDKNFRYDLFTLDITTRGDLARVSRIPNSRHKSGLYCIPLTPGDMYKGMDHIKELAREPRTIDLESIITKTIMLNTKMNIILKNIEKQVIADRKHDVVTKEVNNLRIERYKASTKFRPGAFTDDDLKRAKSIPISQIIGTTAKRTKCPVHHGDNPTSLQINHNKGLWFCYSCRQGGDGIKFVMLRDRVDFKTAVKQLVEA